MRLAESVVVNSEGAAEQTRCARRLAPLDRLGMDLGVVLGVEADGQAGCEVDSSSGVARDAPDDVVPLACVVSVASTSRAMSAAESQDCSDCGRVRALPRRS